ATLKVLQARAAGVMGLPGSLKARHHGGYHLGQGLERDDGADVIIDFEGGASGPLGQRGGGGGAPRGGGGRRRARVAPPAPARGTRRFAPVARRAMQPSRRSPPTGITPHVRRSSTRIFRSRAASHGSSPRTLRHPWLRSSSKRPPTKCCTR